MNLGGPGQHPERPDAAGRVLTVWGSMRNRMSDSTLHWFSMIQPRWADCTEVVIFGGLCKPTVNMLKWSAIVLWAPPWIGWFLASKHDCSWCNQHLQKCQTLWWIHLFSSFTIFLLHCLWKCFFLFSFCCTFAHWLYFFKLTDIMLPH